MTKVGFWTASMSLAMVKVFPVPVAPTRTWALAGTDAFRQGGDGLGLIAHRFIRGDDVKGMRRIVIFIVMRHIHKRYLFLGPFFQFL